MDILQPPGWPKPKGYSNGVVSEGRLIFVSGQVGWDRNETFQSSDLVAQIRQALANTVSVLAEAGAKPEHVTRMTWYLVDKDEYLSRLKEIGNVYRELMGRHFPAMTAVEVSGFIEEGARVEIETTAVLPPE